MRLPADQLITMTDMTYSPMPVMRRAGQMVMNPPDLQMGMTEPLKAKVHSVLPCALLSYAFEV